MNWHQYLEDIIQGEEQKLREDLRENLAIVLKEKKDEIEQFAFKNVLLKLYPGAGESSDFMGGDLFRLFFSAVYFANSWYFERKVDTKRERVTLHVSHSSELANHKDTGRYTHKITIPWSYFKSYTSLFRAMDSESRHAIHCNLLNDKGIKNSRYIAPRVYHIVAETIDEGTPTDIYRTRSFHEDGVLIEAAEIESFFGPLDPLLNDFFMTERDGHVTAPYLLRLLSRDSKARQMQLCWLSRLPIRPVMRHSLHIPWVHIERLTSKAVQYKEMLERLAEESDITDDKQNKAFVCAFSPYDNNPFDLVSFYRSDKATSDLLVRELTKIRAFAIGNFPYIPDNGKGVKIDGKVVSRFASQLDYIALKLILTNPEDLHAEALAKAPP